MSGALHECAADRHSTGGRLPPFRTLGGSNRDQLDCDPQAVHLGAGAGGWRLPRRFG
jgi:hypothetical protein